MKSDPEKPVRLGIMPLGLLYLGLLVMVFAAVGTTKVFELIRWFFRWLAGEN